MTIPVIETERLILRDRRLADFESFAAMWSDPQVVRHMGDGKPLTEEAVWTSFLRAVGHWVVLGYGSWAIDEKASGKLIGSAGFNNMKRDRGPEYKDVLEMGWMFETDASGKGYATEAVCAALAWGKLQFGAIRVIALTAPENFASIRVAQKCGFAECARILSVGRPRIVLDRVL